MVKIKDNVSLYYYNIISNNNVLFKLNKKGTIKTIDCLFPGGYVLDTFSVWTSNFLESLLSSGNKS